MARLEDSTAFAFMRQARTKPPNTLDRTGFQPRLG